MSKLLLSLFCLLAAFFRPGIEDGQEDLQLELNEEQQEEIQDDEQADGQEQEQPDHAKLYADEKAGRASEKERADKFERELADLRANQNRQPPQQDASAAAERAREDAILADPNADQNTKYWINVNRKVISTEQFATNALAQANDIADKTSFGQIAVTNAPLFKRYESRVEEEYQKLKTKGTPAPRAAILRFLIGNDAVEGKLTKKAAPAKKNDANPNLNRGRLPGARSDMNGRNSLSEHEKRRARLENQQI